MVRDPYWLHAYWELSRKSIERARRFGAVLAGARPVLRLCEVLRDGTTTAARQPIRDVEIHGGVNNWYIDVHNPPKSYQLDIGYLAAGGRFYCLARSNVVSTPPAAAGDTFDKNWADVAKDFDRIFAMSGGYSEPEATTIEGSVEERLRRPFGTGRRPIRPRSGREARGRVAVRIPGRYGTDRSRRHAAGRPRDPPR